ncbi:MAG: kynureninase [Planctomycetota bacterium]
MRSWNDSVELPEAVGDELAPLIGASLGEVVLGDQTSVNLFKLAWAGLEHSGRSVILGDDSNFPSDRYVLAAVASALGGEYREVAVDDLKGPKAEDFAASIDEKVGLISLSLVSFKSGAVADLRSITELAHAHGALVLWDLSHAAGAIPVYLDAARVDLAVGCTYKHLNGGPGSPAFLFVRRDLQGQLQQPIPSWFGHDDMFAFEGEYRPAPGIRCFTVGTTPIPSLRCVQAGVELTAKAGIGAIREKSLGLTELFVRGFDARLATLGFELASPRDPEKRGGHISLRHPEAYGVTQALIRRGVIPDFRAHGLIRLGVAPLYNSYLDIWDAIEALVSLVEDSEYTSFGPPPKGCVT